MQGHVSPETASERHVERCLTKSKECARRADTVRDVDPVRNPYAPGAGQRPPELAGRDAELAAFDVALERVERGRPERSLILTGLRGVGKTVTLPDEYVGHVMVFRTFDRVSYGLIMDGLRPVHIGGRLRMPE